jgi:hypothetical protein
VSPTDQARSESQLTVFIASDNDFAFGKYEVFPLKLSGMNDKFGHGFSRTWTKSIADQFGTATFLE